MTVPESSDAILQLLRDIETRAHDIRALLENEDTLMRRNAGYSLTDIEREAAFLIRMIEKRSPAARPSRPQPQSVLR